MKILKQKQYAIEIKDINAEKGVIDAVFSTAMIDRQDEVVDQKSWILTEYLLNPIVLFAHDPYSPAVGKVIELGLNENGNLAGKIQFAVEEYDFAKTLFNLYAAGYMKAFSVGFECLEPTFDNENDVVILRKNILYEISCVAVPANALALAKSKGVDTHPIEKYLDKQKEYLDEKQTNLEKFRSQFEKDGRLLTKADRDVLENALAVLKDILIADGNKTIIPSANKSQSNIKVETPRPAVGGAKKGVYSVRAINKAVRQLLTEKKFIQ